MNATQQNEILCKVIYGGVLSPAERLWLDCQATLLSAARTYNGERGAPRWARVPWYEAWCVRETSRVYPDRSHACGWPVPAR